MWLLFGVARGLARNAGRQGRPKPKPDAQASWIGACLLGFFVLMCCAWQWALALGGLALIVGVLTLNDRRQARVNEYASRDKSLADLLAKWEDDGRHK